MWVNPSSYSHQNGHPASDMVPLLANFPFVVRRLCRASQANILHFLGAKELQISWLPTHEVPPKFKA
jgi:hypothetical protein